MPNYNRAYIIDWNKLAAYNVIFITQKRDPMEEVKKTDELVESMKEYRDAEDVINKAMRK